MNLLFTSFFNQHETTIALRLLLAVILGGIIGLEREYHERPAGLRTHILVSLGAALTMMVSIYGFGDLSDPARLAAQVIPGIGFIGAGAIMRDGGDIKGITTAATLWIATMIGLAVGNGYYFGAILATVISIVVLTYLRSVEKKIGKKRPRLQIIANAKTTVLKPVLSAFEKYGLTYKPDESQLIMYEGTECIRFSCYILGRYDYEMMELVMEDIRKEVNPFIIKVLNFR